MSDVSGLGSSGNNWYADRIQQFQQNLFNKIDTNSDGAITQSELESAVTGAGGTTQSADSLYALLDPNYTGSVSEQQFAQNLPAPPFSAQMGAQLIADQAQQSASANTSTSGSAFAQNLFSQIDANGNGSISQSELENAVTAAGGTTQAADALYAKLDPTNTGSVSEQQFSQSLSQVMGHHHHHHHAQADQDGDAGDASNGSSAQDALAALFNGASGGANAGQVAQDLFSQIDTNSDGSITQSELQNAVTAGGGTAAAADALYAQLDPTNSGSVSETAFAQALQPPSTTGNTAQDALLALVNRTNSSAAASPTTTSASAGTTAQDALWSLIDGANGTTAAGAQSGGTSAQDALAALLQANPGTWPNGWGSVDPQSASGNDLSSMVSLFDTLGQSNQTSQQLLSSLFTAINGGG